MKTSGLDVVLGRVIVKDRARVCAPDTQVLEKLNSVLVNVSIQNSLGFCISFIYYSLHRCHAFLALQEEKSVSKLKCVQCVQETQYVSADQ